MLAVGHWRILCGVLTRSGSDLFYLGPIITKFIPNPDRVFSAKNRTFHMFPNILFLYGTLVPFFLLFLGVGGN